MKEREGSRKTHTNRKRERKREKERKKAMNLHLAETAPHTSH